MKMIKKILAIILFVFQLLISLAFYIYIAHRYSATLTILAAIGESALAMWAYDKLFKQATPKKAALKNLPQEKTILRTISRRNKVGV